MISLQKKMSRILLWTAAAMLILPAADYTVFAGENILPVMIQIEKEYPAIKNYEMLKHMVYLTRSNRETEGLSDMTKKVIENTSRQIIKNKDNVIYTITLEDILYEVLENNRGNDKNYYISSDMDQVIISDSIKNSTKTLVIMPMGDNGVFVNIHYTGTGESYAMIINPKSTGEDIESLRLRTAQFFDNLLPDLTLLNMELNENRDDY